MLLTAVPLLRRCDLAVARHLPLGRLQAGDRHSQVLRRSRHPLELDPRLIAANREFIAAVANHLDLDRLLEQVHRTAGNLAVRQAAASSIAGGLVMDQAAMEVGRYLRRRSDDKDAHEWVRELKICEETHMTPVSVYPALRQFVEAGWLDERWDNDGVDGEPRPKAYRVTEDGYVWLSRAIAERHQAIPLRWMARVFGIRQWREAWRR